MSFEPPTSEVRKTYTLPAVTAATISAARRPEERLEGDTVARIVQEWETARKSLQTLPEGVEVSGTASTGLQEALCAVSGGIAEVVSTLAALEAGLSASGATGAREALEAEAHRFRHAAEAHRAWFAEIESSLQRSYDTVVRATVGFREILPTVQLFSEELRKLPETFSEALQKEHSTTREKTKTLIEESHHKLTHLAQRYQDAIATLVGFPEKVANEAQKLEEKFSRIHALSERGYSENIARIEPAIERGMSIIDTRFQRLTFQTTALVVVPATLVLAGMAFLGFFRPTFEKFESDKLVRETLEPAVQKYATEAMVKQNVFLDSLTQKNETAISQLVANQKKSIEDAVKEYRKQAAEAQTELASVRVDLEKTSTLLTTETLKTDELQSANRTLLKKIKGEWGFADAFVEHLGGFLLFSLFVSAFAFFIGYKVGKD